MTERWISVGSANDIAVNDVRRFDCDGNTYAVVKSGDGKCHVIDGLCTHGKAHLADGFVDGNIIECPKHNGRFDVVSGAAVATPARVAIRVYETVERDGQVEFRV